MHAFARLKHEGWKLMSSGLCKLILLGFNSLMGRETCRRVALIFALGSRSAKFRAVHKGPGGGSIDYKIWAPPQRRLLSRRRSAAKILLEKPARPAACRSGPKAYGEWSGFSLISDSELSEPAVIQDLSPLSFEAYSTIPDSALAGSFCLEQTIDQHHVTYDSSVNDFTSFIGTTSQSVETFPLDHETLSIGAQAAQYSSYDSLQPSFDFSNSLDMSDLTLDISTELSELGGKTKELKCNFPDCSEDIFSTYPALRKHLNKHYKPYHCTIPGCKNPQFGDKGGLDRHTREVHGSKRHYCPITSCKRHRTGFPRKYNLFEHQKRCHPSQSPNPLPSALRPSRDQTPSRNESMEDVQKLDDEVSSPELSVTGGLSTAGGGKVQAKLRALLALRAEIDRDIETLKKTVDILDES